MTALAAAPPRSRIMRDAPALVLSSGVTAALTLGFWALAARTHDAATVGRAAAGISAVTLVAGFAQLNLLGFFLRFLPAAGDRASRLVLVGYAAISAASIIAAGTYVALGFDTYVEGTGTPGHVFFVSIVAAQAIFVVQDGVLTALRKATWVPVENLVTTAARFAALVLPAAGAAYIGIVGAWFLPVALAVVVITTLVLRLLKKATLRRDDEPSSLPSRRAMARFAFAEYVNSLVNNAATFGPPLVVLRAVDAAGAAYFTVPWLVISTTQTLLWNVVMPFISESARSSNAARDAARPTVAIGAVFVGTATVVLFLAARPLLSVQGSDFTAAGAPLLRSLACSIPFTAVFVLFSAIQVVRRRIWVLVALNTAGALLLFTGLRLLLPSQGIVAAGIVHLAVQALLALLVMPAVLRWWRTSVSRKGTRLADVAPGSTLRSDPRRDGGPSSVE